MTIISLMTNDQQLMNVQKPTVASGDIKSVKVQVEFDAAWNDYIVRSAVFHTSKDETIYESLLVDNACIIPHEVLRENGTLFIGIRGYTEDGENLKTSSLVKYKIVPGADSASPTTLEPSKDMYQQFIEAIHGQYDPLSAALIAQYEEFRSEYDAKVNALEENKIQMKVGSYEGNGTYALNSSSSQDIMLGVTPKFVFVATQYGIYDDKMAFVCSTDNPASYLEIIDGGFKATHYWGSSASADAGCNYPSYKYTYLALY